MEKKKGKKSKSDKQAFVVPNIQHTNQLFQRDKDNNSISGNYNYMIDSQYREQKSFSHENSQFITAQLNTAPNSSSQRNTVSAHTHIISQI